MAVRYPLPVIVYRGMRQREADRELGAGNYDRLQPERRTRHLVHRLELLGRTVTLEDRTTEGHAEPPG